MKLLLISGGAMLMALLLRKIYLRLVFKEKSLLNHGFGEEVEKFVYDQQGFLKEKLVNKVVKGKLYKDKLILKRFNHSINEDTVDSYFAPLKKIYGKVISSAEFKNWLWFHQVIFYFQNFPEKISYTDLKTSLKAGCFWIGNNDKNQNLILDARRGGNWSTMICGGDGSGKTTMMISATTSYLKTLIDQKEKLPTLLIVDIKKTDFLGLIESYQKYAPVEFYNPQDLDQLKNLVERLEGYLLSIKTFMKKLADKNISVAHWSMITPDINIKKPELFAMILDELPAYLLDKGSLKKLSKDADELEIKEYEKYALQRRLAGVLNELLNIARPTGTFLILGSQIATTDLLLNYSNLKKSFLLSKFTPQTYQVWGIDSKFAKLKTLRQGLFIFSNSSYGEGLVKSPLINPKDVL